MDRLDSRESPSRIAVIVSGIVQGVGFRPFVYRLAADEGLCGFVRNDGRGVYAEVQGAPERIDSFLRRIRSEAPPAACVLSVEAARIAAAHCEGFTIVESGVRDARPLPVTPDLAACRRCVAEAEDKNDRRYGYPFTNCTDCGPRFTIVESVPYDRPNTTMSEFAMCESCAAEYGDPSDRRFHAEPIACPSCGPQVRLQAGRGEDPAGAAALERAGALLRDGAVVAVKGIGGYHLACDARSEEAVSRLRAGKLRYDRPFALMARDLQTAGALCYVSGQERGLLESAAAPIVLLRRRVSAAGAEAVTPVAPSVAPGLARLGLMLPYTPLHHMLLRQGPPLLVMTSGNLSEEPIAYEDAEAGERLRTLADAFLTHDRRIRTRCDDSVAWVPRIGRPQIVRRSRGYAPCPLPLPAAAPCALLAVGGHFKNTFCLAEGETAYMSHHIGDTANAEALESFEEGVEQYKTLFSVHPLAVAYDMHPDYLTSKYALDLACAVDARASGRAVAVQHHHAHVASCMAENAVPAGEVVLGVAFDGTGYGPDGTVWGGEFLLCDYSDYRRFAHMGYMPLPGGEAAVGEPWRLGAYACEALLGPAFESMDLPLREHLDLGRWGVLRRATRAGVNAPLCCSVGRLFDCVAAILGIRGSVNYEGQAAVELEAAAIAWGADVHETALGLPPYTVSVEGGVVPWEPIVRGVLDDVLGEEDPGLVAARFHRTIAEAVSAVANAARSEEGVDSVALTGGAFVNTILHHLCADVLAGEGFRVLLHSSVPPNDGGIAYGQAAVAAVRLAGCEGRR
jgi:hydrogenase maturation protein HypF